MVALIVSIWIIATRSTGTDEEALTASTVATSTTGGKNRTHLTSSTPTPAVQSKNNSSECSSAFENGKIT